MHDLEDYKNFTELSAGTINIHPLIQPGVFYCLLENRSPKLHTAELGYKPTESVSSVLPYETETWVLTLHIAC